MPQSTFPIQSGELSLSVVIGLTGSATLAVEVLVGLDVLLDCRFLIDGPGRQFVLDW
jgi:hypothetical protein